MAGLQQNIVRPGFEPQPDPDFPHAPVDWSFDTAMKQAKEEHLKLTGEHWEVVRALQEFYARHEGPTINVRELHDALDEHFHAQGGIRHLYEIFPQGPVAQGCRLAGLEAPAGATDKSFGSVV